MSEWDNIEGVNGWAKKLQDLLKEAEQAAQNPDFLVRHKISSRLTEFILKSGPNVPEIVALDTVANKARASLLRTTIEERLVSLSARTGELARLMKEFQASAAAGEQEADSIRLAKTKTAIDSMTSTIQVLKELENMFADGEHLLVTDQLKKAIQTIQKLRNDVEAVL